MNLSHATRREIYQVILSNYWNEKKRLFLVTENLQPSSLSIEEHELLDGWHLYSSVGEIVLCNTDIKSAKSEVKHDVFEKKSLGTKSAKEFIIGNRLSNTNLEIVVGETNLKIDVSVRNYYFGQKALKIILWKMGSLENFWPLSDNAVSTFCFDQS